MQYRPHVRQHEIGLDLSPCSNAFCGAFKRPGCSLTRALLLEKCSAAAASESSVCR